MKQVFVAALMVLVLAVLLGWPVPAVLARRALAQHSETAEMNPPLATYLTRQKFVLAAFERLKRSDAARVLYPHRVLCARGACEVALEGVPLYRDEHHLSVLGARRLTPLLQQAF